MIERNTSAEELGFKGKNSKPSENVDISKRKIPYILWIIIHMNKNSKRKIPAFG